MDNCWISCQVMDDMKKVYDGLIIINLYQLSYPIIIKDGTQKFDWNVRPPLKSGNRIVKGYLMGKYVICKLSLVRV